MRQWINLVEDMAAPSLLYHGSNQRIVTAYLPLTHFGTELAANQRAVSIATSRRAKTGEAVTWIHPVHVAIRNALEIHDDHGLEHSPIKLTDMLFYDYSIISSDERAQIFKAGGFGDNQSNNDAVALIVEFCARHGYDGFVYRNVHEDAGSLSWVNFYSEQVTPAGEPWETQVD